MSYCVTSDNHITLGCFGADKDCDDDAIHRDLNRFVTASVISASSPECAKEIMYENTDQAWLSRLTGLHKDKESLYTDRTKINYPGVSLELENAEERDLDGSLGQEYPRLSNVTCDDSVSIQTGTSATVLCKNNSSTVFSENFDSSCVRDAVPEGDIESTDIATTRITSTLAGSNSKETSLVTKISSRHRASHDVNILTTESASSPLQKSDYVEDSESAHHDDKFRAVGNQSTGYSEMETSSIVRNIPKQGEEAIRCLQDNGECDGDRDLEYTKDKVVTNSSYFVQEHLEETMCHESSSRVDLRGFGNLSNGKKAMHVKEANTIVTVDLEIPKKGNGKCENSVSTQPSTTFFCNNINVSADASNRDNVTTNSTDFRNNFSLSTGSFKEGLHAKSFADILDCNAYVNHEIFGNLANAGMTNITASSLQNVGFETLRETLPTESTTIGNEGFVPVDQFYSIRRNVTNLVERDSEFDNGLDVTCAKQKVVKSGLTGTFAQKLSKKMEESRSTARFRLSEFMDVDTFIEAECMESTGNVAGRENAKRTTVIESIYDKADIGSGKRPVHIENTKRPVDVESTKRPVAVENTKGMGDVTSTKRTADLLGNKFPTLINPASFSRPCNNKEVIYNRNAVASTGSNVCLNPENILATAISNLYANPEHFIFGTGFNNASSRNCSFQTTTSIHSDGRMPTQSINSVDSMLSMPSDQGARYSECETPNIFKNFPGRGNPQAVIDAQKFSEEIKTKTRNEPKEEYRIDSASTTPSITGSVPTLPIMGDTSQITPATNLTAESNTGISSFQKNLSEPNNAPKYIPTSAIKNFGCTLCGKRFHTKANLKRHEVVHSGKKNFPCLVCGKEFSREYNLTTHGRIHTAEKLYKCDVCDKGFYWKSCLSRHMSTHTEEIKDLTCPVCGKVFFNKSYVKGHMVVHTGEKKFKCDICGKGFSFAVSMRKHRMVAHTGEKHFKCDICGKEFSQKSNLNLHRTVHTTGAVKKYECDVCGKSFSTKEKMSLHIATHTDEFKCDVCGKNFCRSSALEKHKEVHETGKEMHECDVCGKAFTRKANLEHHRVVHSGEKNFSCDVCGKSYYYKVNLMQHMAVHNGSYKCHLCGKVFGQQSRLTQHMTAHLALLNPPAGEIFPTIPLPLEFGAGLFDLNSYMKDDNLTGDLTSNDPINISVENVNGEEAVFIKEECHDQTRSENNCDTTRKLSSVQSDAGGGFTEFGTSYSPSLSSGSENFTARTSLLEPESLNPRLGGSDKEPWDDDGVVPIRTVKVEGTDIYIQEECGV